MPELKPTYLINPTIGLDVAILRILVHHQGRQRAISRVKLCSALSLYQTNERQVREQIKQLRRAGHLIGSAAGENGGYYLISSLDEFNQFMQCEFLAKIKDMSQTAHSMTKAATQQFGPNVNQLALF